MSEPEDADADGSPETSDVIVLDHLPHGRADDDRPQYQKSPLAYGLGIDSFGLYELTLVADSNVSIGDRVTIAPPDAADLIERYRAIDYADLSSNAQSELEYAVEAVIEADEQRFVDFYNDAQPITLRLHQLNLLPGIGKKLRNNILDERKRKPFESFEELTDRVSGLHRPEEVLVDRIMEELRDEDLKYKTFVRREEEH